MTDDTPEQTDARIKRMYPHLYSKYGQTSRGVKPPPAPERKENRYKNARNFFGAKRALVLFALLFLTGCDDALDSPQTINQKRYREALNDSRRAEMVFDRKTILEPSADATSVALPLKAEIDAPVPPPQVEVKMKSVRISNLVCPHCGKSIRIVEGK